MFSVGELVTYSKHGLCRIDEICDRTYGGDTKAYYVLRPENDQQLTINIPVDNSKSLIMKLMDKDHAIKILDSFKSDGAEWTEKPQLRNQAYKNTLTGGNRLDIAKVAITLMQKKYEAEQEQKKFSENDNTHLTTIQNTLFRELALALNTTYEEINEQVYGMVTKNI